MPIFPCILTFLICFIVFGALTIRSNHLLEAARSDGFALRELNRTLEERNESLDRQNQLMERQYNLFAIKPVITYLHEEQFASLIRVVTHTIIAIAKQPN